MWSGPALGGGGFGQVRQVRTYRSAFAVPASYAADADVYARDIGGFRAVSLYLTIEGVGAPTSTLALELGWLYDNSSTNTFLVMRRSAA